MKLITKLKLDNLSRPTQLLLFAVVLVVFVILILLSRSWSEKQIIKQINISGNQFVSNDEIYSIISDKVINKFKKDIELEFLRDSLLLNPYILNVDLSIGITGNLKVEISERKPVAYITAINGKVDYIDKSGVILPFKVLNQNLDLPVITGIRNGNSIDSTSLISGSYIIDFLKNKSESDIYVKISELKYDYRNKSYNLVINDYPGIVKLGRVDNLEEKVFKLDKLINTDGGYEILKVADYIDLRWTGQIIAGKI